MSYWTDRTRGRAGAAFVLMGLLILGAFAAGVPSVIGEDTGTSRPRFPTSGVWFEQVVTHPRTDWQGDGRVSVVDEFVLVRNLGKEAVEVDGWLLQMIDGTDEELVLDGVLEHHEPWIALNPPGQINNDVTLRLLDDQGLVVDEVTLGESGIPDGRGGSLLDEAVHLTGHWAGLRAPGTTGGRLGPVWVSHLAVEGTMEHARPLDPAWVATEGGRLDVRLEVAEGYDPGPLELVAGDEQVTLEAVDPPAGLWRTVAPLGPSEEDRSVQVVGEGLRLASFPAGSPLGLHVDPVDPSLVGIPWPPGEHGEPFVAAVADGEGRIQWFPSVEAGPSGLMDVQVLDAQGEVLEDCAPLEEPGAGCMVDGGGNVTLRLSDGAGRVVQQTLPVVVWDAAPEVPEIAFEPAASPTLSWDHPSRPVKAVVVEVAEDPEGTWILDEPEVPVGSGGYVDGSWVPGQPRAYRLVITDLAGNRGEGPWVVLEPKDVPVQVEWDVADLVGLGTVGETDVTLRFDRPLQEPPVLALRLERPVPLYLEVEGEPIVSQDAFVYRVQLPARIEEGVGTWGLLGGRGEDGAPVEGPARNLTWDAGAPRVQVDGVPAFWVLSSRHVVTVRAVDTVDPAPVLSLPEVPAGATVSLAGRTAQVVLHGEGLYGFEGTARDASGNEQGFSVRLGLDPSPPRVTQIERPSHWSVEQPVVFRVEDEVSGVNDTSLQVWARDVTGAFEPALEHRGNGTVALFPGERSELVEGPFEVYVAIADQAGNGAEGFLSQRMRHVPQPENGTQVPHKLVPEGGPVSVQAPSFLGPPWQGSGQRTDASVGGMHNANVSSQDASRWDGFDWADAPSEKEEGRSWGWYVVALVGMVTLGTAVHRVRSHRNRSQKRPSGGADEETGKGQQEKSPEADRDRASRPPDQQVPGEGEEDPPRPHGHDDEESAPGSGMALAAPDEDSSSCAVPESGEGEEGERGGQRQLRLDLWCGGPLLGEAGSRPDPPRGPRVFAAPAGSSEVAGGDAAVAA